MIGFWMSNVNGKNAKFSKFLISFFSLKMIMVLISMIEWIQCIKAILISVGCADLLHKEVIQNPHFIKMQISKTLSDLYIQEWHSKVTASSKGKNYNLLKIDVNFENYLSKVSKKHYSTLLQLR